MKILNELEYKDIIKEIIPNSVAGQRLSKLPYRDWSPLLKSVHIEAIRGNTLKFNVPSGINTWNTYIRFDEWDDQVNDSSVNANDASRLLLWGGNIRLHCNCPAFLYWGFQYILTQLDAAIFPEIRFPHVRNEHLKGICCKHGIKTLKVLPFHLGDMASAIKRQRAGIKGTFVSDRFEINNM